MIGTIPALTIRTSPYQLTVPTFANNLTQHGLQLEHRMLSHCDRFNFRIQFLSGAMTSFYRFFTSICSNFPFFRIIRLIKQDCPAIIYQSCHFCITIEQRAGSHYQHLCTNSQSYLFINTTAFNTHNHVFIIRQIRQSFQNQIIYISHHIIHFITINRNLFR